MSAACVLVVEDDPGIQRLVRLQLEEDGFNVISAESGEEALELLNEQRPDAVLLDLGLPGAPGYEVMRLVRERWGTPVLLVTARVRDTEKIQGLELGADDYIAKPFNPEEVSARVRAVLRRTRARERPERAALRWGDVEVDLERRVVTRAGAYVPLTRTEWSLLESLAENAGRVILRTELLTKTWGPEYREDFQYLRVWVSRLRRKLEPDRSEGESMIRTFPGMGYMLTTPEAEEETG